MIYILKHFIYAFTCTIGFAIIFNTPKNSLIKAGLSGAIGWTIYTLAFQYSASAVFSTFAGAFFVALSGEIFAIKDKNPITVYIIPGIVPLVPGYSLYYTMLSVLENDNTTAAARGGEALMVAIAIAAALTIILSLNAFRKRRLLNNVKENPK